eukprot:gene27697-7339_t
MAKGFKDACRTDPAVPARPHDDQQRLPNHPSTFLASEFAAHIDPPHPWSGNRVDPSYPHTTSGNMLMRGLLPAGYRCTSDIGKQARSPLVRPRSSSVVGPRGTDGLRRIAPAALLPTKETVEAVEVEVVEESKGLSPYIAPVAALATLGMALPALASAVPVVDLSSAFYIPGIVGDSPLREGFVSGFLLIFFSEMGDKTFFIALLLALKEDKRLVYIGTFSALAVMTVISVGLGQALHVLDELVPSDSPLAGLPLDDIVASLLLIFFGVKTLQDAKDADETAKEEKEEAQEVVDAFSSEDALKLIFSTFVLVFAAEWGDKSFLATIALAASSSPLGVTAGAVAGHGVATGIAVFSGSLLSRYFSESTLQYIGGTLFLVFAGATIVDLVGQVS